MSRAGRTDYPVACTDQRNHRILLFRPDVYDWNTDEALLWSWSAASVHGFEDLLPAWGLPTDAKLRVNRVCGGQSFVLTDSRGLAAIVPYPAGDFKQWGLNVGGNPHSAELLPNGNLAVAASTGGWVRIYASSQGPSCETYAEYAFAGAHGVHWDPQREVLWAVGDDCLVALKVEGPDRQPVVREVHKATLPTRHGHDLQPVALDQDRLWVSTGSNVYQYVKSTGQFDAEYRDSRLINRRGVKSIGNQPSGVGISTVPKPGGLYEWTTDEVDFYDSDSVSGRIRKDAAFYKARIWNPEYE